MKQIAGENVFLLDNFDELLSIVDDIGDAVCQPIIEAEPNTNRPQSPPTTIRVRAVKTPEHEPLIQQQVPNDRNDFIPNQIGL